MTVHHGSAAWRWRVGLCLYFSRNDPAAEYAPQRFWQFFAAWECLCPTMGCSAKAYGRMAKTVNRLVSLHQYDFLTNITFGVDVGKGRASRSRVVWRSF